MQLWTWETFMPTTRKIWTHQSLLTKVWVSHINIWASKMHGHDTHDNQQYLRRGETLTMSPRDFRWCASLFQLIMNNNQGFVTTLRTIPSWVRTMTQRPQPPHMTYCSITKSRRHNAKQIHHPGFWHFSRLTMQTSARKFKEKMGDHFRILCATAAGKWDTIQQTDCHKQITIERSHNH